jgi:GT2 family glycosyltransferase
MSRATAIVVTFNSAEVLPECLASLRANGAAAIVVDNASDDSTVSVAEAAGAVVIRNGENLGYGRANNIGVRAAETDYVLICNPDAQLDEGALDALLAAARLYPEAGLYAPRIFEPDGREYFKTESYLTPGAGPSSKAATAPEGDVCTPMILGACLMMRRELFLELGGFDENIFLFYEDDDLCRRLSDRGRALIYVHAATARHRRGASSQPRKGLIYLSRYHQAWSRAYVARKYGLKSPAFGMMLVNGLKLAGAWLSGNARRIERYGGSFAGALAAMREAPAPRPRRMG